MYRQQKNLTIPVDKLDDVFKNFGKMPNTKLAELIGMNYGKLVQNLKLLELIKPREIKYFDEKKFWKDNYQ